MNETEKIQSTDLGEENTTPTPSENAAPAAESGASVPEYAYTSAEPAPVLAEQPEVVENVAAGVVGAILFALVGGLAYFIFYQMNIIAGLAGFIAVICAVKGYSIFAKKESLKGVIIAIVASIVVIIAAEFISIAVALLPDLKTAFPEANVNFFTSTRYVFSLFAENNEFRIEVIGELAIALVLCAIASFTSIRNAIGSAKANKK